MRSVPPSAARPQSAAPTPFAFLQRGGGGFHALRAAAASSSSGHRIGLAMKKRKKKRKLKGKTGQILVDESIALPDPQTLLLDQERTSGAAAAALPGSGTERLRQR